MDESDSIRQALIEEGFAEIADQIIASLRPSIRLRAASVSMEALPLGASRLGGLPDVPAGWQLPPLSFVAQINLADTAPYDVQSLLPDRGWLYFFYNAKEQPWGEPYQAEGWKVLYAPDPSEPLHRTTPGPLPPDMPQFPACRLACSPALTTISVDEMVRYFKQSWEELEKPDWERLDRLIEFLDELSIKPVGVVHQMLGHPDPVQGPVEREWAFTAGGITFSDANNPKRAELIATAPDWRLLLQVDSDSKCRMMWGDVGRIYYGIHKDHLAARDFSRVWLSMQCS